MMIASNNYRCLGISCWLLLSIAALAMTVLICVRVMWMETVTPPLPGLDSIVQEQITEIEQELQGRVDNPPWAGVYRSGSQRGRNTVLYLAADAGFAFICFGEGGLWKQNLGSIRDDGGKLTLDCQLANETNAYASVQTEYVHIPWGARNYLVAPEEMAAFGNDVKAGVEPRRVPTGQFLMRAGDEALSVQGEPELPADYSAVLVAPPIRARVIELLPQETEDPFVLEYIGATWVLLDLSRDDGAHTWMELDLEWPELRGVHPVATIRRTGELGSVAVVNYCPSRRKPDVGWIFVRNTH